MTLTRLPCPFILKKAMSTQNTINHKTILNLAGPMILANISIPILGMVDTAVIGHLNSAHYLGAVAIASIIFSFLFWGFSFLRMATTGLTAQADGGKNPQLSAKILQHTLLLALVIAASILCLQSPISELAFSLMSSSPNVTKLAIIYFDIRIWSTPALLLNYVILGWLIGKGATKHVLLLVLTVTISNMVLDILFVNYFDMNVDGVALASVLAEYLGLIVSIKILINHGINLSIFTLNNNVHIDTKSWLASHGNIFIRSLCLIFVIAFFTAQGAKQGEIILATNAVLVNFLVLMAFVLDGFANAIEVISGNAIGEKNKSQLKQGLKLAAIWSFGIACLFSLNYFLFGTHLIALLTTIPDVIETAHTYLIWLIILPMISVWAFLFDGLFIGAIRGAEMRNSMLLSTLIFFSAWYFLQDYDNHGLWLSFLIFSAARGIIQACYLPRILSIK